MHDISLLTFANTESFFIQNPVFGFFVFIPRKITNFNLNTEIFEGKISAIVKNNTFKMLYCAFLAFAQPISFSIL